MNDPLKICPACDSTDIKEFLQVKDYLVSGETFSLMQCNSCKLLQTSPIPDPDTLSKYYASNDYISHTNKSSNLINFLYKIVRYYTINNKYILINKYSTEKTILDIGCGTGNFLKKFQNKGWEITGIEPDTVAKKKAEHFLDSTIQKSLQELPSSKYSVITMWHVLEHMPDLNSSLETINQHLDTHSVLFVAVPNYQSPDAQHYGKFWAGYDAPRHLYHFSKSSMARLMGKHNLVITEIIPMKWDSYYVSLLSEKNMHPNQLPYYNALIQGYNSNKLARSNVNNSSLIYVINKKI